MKAWYFPTWNGDLRLEPDPKAGDRTLLSVIEPSPHEQRVLAALETLFRKEGWWKGDEPLYTPPKSGWLRRRQKMVTVTVDAPLHAIGPLVAQNLKPGPSTLTAIKFEGGRVIAIEGVESELADGMRAALGVDAEQPAYREPPPKALPAPEDKSSDVLAAAVAEAREEKEKAKAAVTVQRPTPCCPRCIPGAVEPASEVLLSFLTPEQHESWASDRCLIAIGGYTGTRYLLAHRHTERAQKIGRVCYSLDDEAVIHFHQTEVPPEEEVLAAKLILELREDWLRNEATLFSGAQRFKNPFGNGNDGIPDASLMSDIGLRLFGDLDRSYVLNPFLSPLEFSPLEFP